MAVPKKTKQAPVQTAPRPSAPPEPAGDLAQVRRKLFLRIGMAGAMIVALLGGLVLFDYLTSDSSEPEATLPRFTAPVPVAKKPVTQPLGSLDTPPPTPAADKAAEPEATAAPADRSRGETLTAEHAPAASSRAAAGPRPGTPVRQGSIAGRGTAASEPAPARPDERAGPRASAERTAPARDVASTAATPPLPPGSGYSLQAGVFADPRAAEALQARLQQEGIPVRIEARVLVGPYRSRKEADAARAHLSAMGIEVMPLPRKAARK